MELNPEAFSASQLTSKLWAAEELEKCVKENNINSLNMYILGGWYALLFFILKVRNNIPIAECRSFDIDQEACMVANTLNITWEQNNWSFRSFPKDVNSLEYPENVNCVINTSSEHIEDNDWFENIPDGVLCLIQSNNLQIPEHVNTVRTIEELMEKYPLSKILYTGTKSIRSYRRFMLIGIK